MKRSKRVASHWLGAAGFKSRKFSTGGLYRGATGTIFHIARRETRGVLVGWARSHVFV